MRTSLVMGLPLGFLALGIVHRISDGDVPLRLIIGLPLAALSTGFIFGLPVLVSHIPVFAPHFLKNWRVLRYGLAQQNGLGTQLIPWTIIDSFSVEKAQDEITLNVDARIRNEPHRLSLTCRRTDVSDETVAVLSAAIQNKILR